MRFLLQLLSMYRTLDEVATVSIYNSRNPVVSYIYRVLQPEGHTDEQTYLK